MQLLPENTLSSFREAIRLGAHMIEFDVRLSKDGHPVVIHDQSVERTTDGMGDVADLNLVELRKFTIRDSANEHIPTLVETLAIMPRHIWLNIHLKGKAERGGRVSRMVRSLFPRRTKTDLAATVASLLAEHQRLHQAFLACGGVHAAAARRAEKEAQICYLLRGSDSRQAVREAVEFGAQFIQLSERRPPNPELIAQLKRHNIRVTYGFAETLADIQQLFDQGIDFPLVNNIHDLMPQAERAGLFTRKT